MNDLQTEVRETFRDVAGRVPVLPFDEVQFRSRVRAGRRRRTGLRVASVALAAAVAAVALVAVPPLLDDDAGRGGQVAGGLEVAPSALPQPLYFLAGTRLTAVTPDGEVHDLGRFEEVVGSTAEGVLAVDTDSGLVWIAASSSGEGDGSFTFEPGAGPVQLPATGPVQSAALSADGRFLAWLGLDGVVTTYDLKARATVQEAQVARNGYVTSVSEAGVLVSEGRRLTLYGASDVDVPVEGDGSGWVSDTVGDFVTVADRDDVTRVYDVTRTVRGDTARLVDSVPGTGRLSPYALGIVSVDGSSVQLWTGGDPGDLTGLEGAPQSASWLDEDHVVVTTAESGGAAIYVCQVADLACTRVALSEEDARLGG